MKDKKTKILVYVPIVFGVIIYLMGLLNPSVSPNSDDVFFLLFHALSFICISLGLIAIAIIRTIEK